MSNQDPRSALPESEVEAFAREIHASDIGTFAIDRLIYRIARRAAEVATERAAKAVCGYCAGKWKTIFDPVPWRNAEGEYVHAVLPPRERGWAQCEADAILADPTEGGSDAE